VFSSLLNVSHTQYNTCPWVTHPYNIILIKFNKGIYGLSGLMVGGDNDRRQNRPTPVRDSNLLQLGLMCMVGFVVRRWLEIKVLTNSLSVGHAKVKRCASARNPAANSTTFPTPSLSTNTFVPCTPVRVNAMVRWSWGPTLPPRLKRAFPVPVSSLTWRQANTPIIFLSIASKASCGTTGWTSAARPGRTGWTAGRIS